MGEVHDRFREEGYHRMIRELSSVVYGEGSSFFYGNVLPCTPYRPSHSFCLLSLFELHSDEISSLSLDERKYRAASVLADDRISFPVSDLLPLLDLFRSIIDHLSLLDLVFFQSLFLFSIAILLSFSSEVFFHELAVMLVDPIVHRIFRECFTDSCRSLFSYP